MAEPEVPVHRERRRLWVALAVTAVAAPFLVLDNLPADAGDDEPVTTLGVVAPSLAPDDRPETGPPKGLSVVNSSTTSSTEPIVITTTTLAD